MNNIWGKFITFSFIANFYFFIFLAYNLIGFTHNWPQSWISSYWFAFFYCLSLTVPSYHAVSLETNAWMLLVAVIEPWNLRLSYTTAVAHAPGACKKFCSLRVFSFPLCEIEKVPSYYEIKNLDNWNIYSMLQILTLSDTRRSMYTCHLFHEYLWNNYLIGGFHIRWQFQKDGWAATNQGLWYRSLITMFYIKWKGIERIDINLLWIRDRCSC